jgi:predicted nucleic acid-binding protein
MIVYVDANIVLNLWRKETDPKTGRELWRSSGKLLEKIELGEFTGIMGITTVMEILHAVRVYTKNKNQEVKKAIESLRRYGIKFIIPTEVIMADAFVYFMERHFDPYDAVAISVAVHENAIAFASRDKSLGKKATDLINVKEPDELVK